MTIVEASHWMDDESECDGACGCVSEYFESVADTVRPGKRCRTSVEQVGRAQHTGPRHRRDEKRFTVRLMRRAGKRFMDDAPRRVPFRGWAD